MKWLLGVALLLCTGTLWAQSLGDVARAQRNGNNGPKATRVFTNGDLAASSEAAPSLPLEKPPPGAQPPRPDRTQYESDRAQAAEQQRRLNEKRQRVQLIESEMRDMEGERISLNRSIYSDTSRIQRSDEVKRMATEIDGKRRELSIARDDLEDEMERANKAGTVK